MDKKTYDICIIGGGINGCGIARDAAGRGYKVLLLEQGDLASATSSASTKLIHGGLRYLEQFQFGLVKKALRERDVLLNLAPHIIWPMRFVLPYVPHIRPFWMIRLGVYLYDFLAGKTRLKKSKTTDIKNKFLKAKFNKGIAYSDCWVEDSRLVVLNAMDAKMRGADILTHEKCLKIDPEQERWKISTEKGQDYFAQMIVNAAGPWASQLMSKVRDVQPKSVRLVKGTHIVIPKLYPEDESYILQNDDKRIVFTIPYEQDYTLVGTTDIDCGNNPDIKPVISDEEKIYLSNVIKYYFNKTIQDIDIIHSYSGVRPLLDDGEDASYASRDYEFDIQYIDGLPFLSVIGGKITTFRILAQQAVDHVDKAFQNTPIHWTQLEKLPGGDIENCDMNAYVSQQMVEYPFLSKQLLTRYAKAYGTCMTIILDNVKSLDDMGVDIGGGVYGRELDYLRAYEFAHSGEDVLWRRSKLGLHLDKDTQKAINHYMASRE